MTDAETKPRAHGCLFVLGIVVLAALVSALAALGVSWWWYNHHFNAEPLIPVQVAGAEKASLDQRVDTLRQVASHEETPAEAVPAGTLVLTEREVNALFEQDTRLGDRFYIDFEPGRISVQARIPLPPDVPLLGGKNVRAEVDVSAGMDAGRLAVRVIDVRAGGFSLPSPWIGNIRHQNLVEETGSGTLLSLVADGISDFRIEKDNITLILGE